MSTKKKGNNFKLLSLFLFLGTCVGDYGIGVGIGEGGVWVGGGGGNPKSDPGSAPKQQTDPAYSALQSWKTAITEDPSGVLKTWVGEDVCSYKGIFCSGSSVTAIDLNKANLKGTIVKDLSLLSDLTILHLNSNRFSGQLPDSLRALSSLQELDLSNNRFSSLFNKQLDAILLNNNGFTGDIPGNLGSSSASLVNLANNKLSGEIPTSFGISGSKLKEVLFLNNQLTGCIPESVGLFSDIEVLDVSFNSLMGHVPDTISCLSEIEVLNLGHNKFSGDLPDLVCSLRNLLNLTVAYNFFSGFSSECSRISFGFDFAGNCIPGKGYQRPQPDCSVIPGGSLSCLRIPAQPLTCAAILGLKATSSSP
ncbi:hypothetical protein DY000_02057351 [Brassica cretica]|uniref:Cell wall hydroxyproline-rich glycoprotein n=1 Tax=Brassica cretica TaxID=69181 RepID=A0ABQ7A9A0_BRACR|nr:hypothetical protein DY000_02057351 [Brassica cretica]